MTKKNRENSKQRKALTPEQMREKKYSDAAEGGLRKVREGVDQG